MRAARLGTRPTMMGYRISRIVEPFIIFCTRYAFAATASERLKRETLLAVAQGPAAKKRPYEQNPPVSALAAHLSKVVSMSHEHWTSFTDALIHWAEKSPDKILYRFLRNGHNVGEERTYRGLFDRAEPLHRRCKSNAIAVIGSC